MSHLGTETLILEAILKEGNIIPDKVRGVYQSSKRAYEIFKTIGFSGILRIFLEKKKIFANSVQDVYRVIRPLTNLTMC